MGNILPDHLNSCCQRMYPTLTLVLVLPALVVCQGDGDGDGDDDGRVEADPHPGPTLTDLAASSCDHDLLPCSDDDDDTCDCPSEDPREQRSTSDCLTVSGEKCKFPFNYRGKTYRECTTVDDKDNFFWCATTLHRSGNAKHWGHCSSGTRKRCMFRYDVLVGTNKLRTRYGRGTLRRNAELEENAQNWANFLTRGRICKYRHQNPLPFLEKWAVGENLAGHGDMTAEWAVDGWWNSPVHRSNMMNERFTRMGVGIATGCRNNRGDAHNAWIAVALYAGD